MAVYSVHLPQGGAPAATEAAFVREGFSAPAFLFGPLFLIWRGFFLGAAVWFAAALALIALAAAGLISAGAALLLYGLMHLWLGLEADRLIGRRLWRQGFDLAELVAAPGLEEAEIAFYRAIVDPADAGTLAPAAHIAAKPASGVIGSLPEPEQRGAAR